MPVRAALGAVIKARRIELGWTQEEFAERISADGEHVRQSEISRIENGKIALPRRERLERIALVLDLTLGELLARSGWAGARESFDQVAVGEVVTQHPAIVAPNLPSVEDVGGNHMIDGVTVAAGSHDPCVDASNRDAVRALRQALQRMRVESERLSQNRQQAFAIGRQIEEQYASDAGTSWAGDQPEATDS